MTADSLEPGQPLNLRFNNFINTSMLASHVNLQMAETPIRFVTLLPNYFGSDDTTREQPRIFDGYRSSSFVLTKLATVLAAPAVGACLSATDCPTVDIAENAASLPVSYIYPPACTPVCASGLAVTHVRVQFAGGFVASNWTLPPGTYNCTRSIVINMDVTLTVAAGVTLQMAGTVAAN